MKLDISELEATIESIRIARSKQLSAIMIHNSVNYIKGYPVEEVMKIKDRYPIERYDYPEETLVKVFPISGVELIFVCSDSDPM